MFCLISPMYCAGTGGKKWFVTFFYFLDLTLARLYFLSFFLQSISLPRNIFQQQSPSLHPGNIIWLKPLSRRKNESRSAILFLCRFYLIIDSEWTDGCLGM